MDQVIKWSYLVHLQTSQTATSLELPMISFTTTSRKRTINCKLYVWCISLVGFVFSYTQNGLLNMLDRNRRTKEAPQRFQLERVEFDVILALEERVYDQVSWYLDEKCIISNFIKIIEDLHTREEESGHCVHVINIDIQDNHEEATIGAWLVCDMCAKVSYCHLFWNIRFF